MNNELSMKRLYLLMRCDMLLQKRTVLLMAGVILGVLFLYAILTPEVTSAMFARPHLFLTLLFLVGFWVSSKTFRVLHLPRLARGYLLLPASQMEKFISRLFLTSFGLALFGVVIYFIFSLLVYGLVWVFYQVSVPIFAITSEALWRGIAIYCILQSVVLLSSIYFKNHCLLKLVLTLAILKLCLFVFTLCMSLIFFVQVPTVVSYEILALPTTGPLVKIMFSWLFWFGLAPFCWLVSYVRLKESEEAHGI